MDYSIKYNEFKYKIEDELKILIPEKEPASLYQPVKYILNGGGKRIRPALSMIAAGAVGGKTDDGLYPGIALEILHNFTLVHDDIMDRSPLRRGRKTIHTKWNEAVGILSGDLMVGHSYKILAKMAAHPRYANIIDVFNRGYIQVCEGQGFDMDFNNSKKITLNDYLKMIEQKTSFLLITGVLMGAHAGNAKYSQITALRDFAYNLGLGFQIQDDLMDMTADQEKFGKKTGQDIVEGKKTYLIIKAKELAQKDEDVKLLNKFFEENGLTSQYIPKIKKLFEDLDIFTLAQKEVESYFQKAKDSLSELKENEYVGMLNWITDSLNKRIS